MVVLSRKLGEVIVVPQCELTTTVIAIEGNKVRLGISAPAQVGVYREELRRKNCAPANHPPVMNNDSQGDYP